MLRWSVVTILAAALATPHALADEPLPLTMTELSPLSIGAGLLGADLNPVHARQMVTFDDDGLAKSFDVSSGVELWRHQVVGGDRVSYQTAYATAFSPSGKLLAVSNHYVGFAKLLDATTGALIRDLDLPTDTVFKGCRTVAFSGDERYLACGDWNGFRVQIWETETGRLVKSLRGAENTQWSLAFSADQRLMYQIGFNYIRVWDLQTDELIRRIEPPRVTPLSQVGVIKSGFLSADGRYAALSVFSYDRDDRPEHAIGVVNLETGVAVRTFRITGRMVAGTFVGDEMRVLLPRMVRVYDVRLGTIKSEGAIPVYYDLFVIPMFRVDDESHEREFESENEFLWIADTPMPVHFSPQFDFIYTPRSGGEMGVWEISQ